MAITTMAAITARQRAIVEGLIPLRSRSTRFRSHRGDRDFLTWAEDTPGAAFRAFEVADVGEASIPDVSDLNVAVEIGATEVTVAYPHKWGLYGRGNRRDMETTIEIDMRQIDDAIGLNGLANYLAGQCKAIGTSTVIEGDGVSFLLMRYEIEYFRSVNA